MDMDMDMDMEYFKKRTFTFSSFIKDIAQTFINFNNIKNTMRSKRISSDFSEKIMLAVTSVNGCVYCNYLHTQFALENGSDIKEIEEIMSLEFKNINSHEAPALAFAQHFAETKNIPSKKSLKTLIKFYGIEKAKDIIILCQMISFGNLFGNTISAFESRMQGIPPENGSFLFEFIIYCWFGYPFLLYKKKHENSNLLKKRLKL